MGLLALIGKRMGFAYTQKCTGEAEQVSLSAEGRSHHASGGRCAVATGPAHGEMGLSGHDPALRFVNEAAVGLCFHATRWHVVTRCGVRREEVLEGIHYETWLGLVWGLKFRPVLLPPTYAKRMPWAGIICVAVLCARNGLSSRCALNEREASVTSYLRITPRSLYSEN
jgi:hypothetical protein